MKFIWNVDPVLIHIHGEFGIRYYGVLFALLFLGGFFLYRWQVLRAGGTEDDAYNVVIPGALGVVIGARLGHAFFYEPSRVLADPLWVLRIWEGGLASHGALIGALLGLYYYARRYKQAYMEVMDRFTFSAALATIVIRLGNFINSEIVGRVTDGTWGVRFPIWDRLPPELAPLRHPSQLYEAAMGCVVMAVLYIVDRRFGREKRYQGLLTGTFLTVYFTGRFIVEYFKEYQALPSDYSLTMGQILSFPVVLVGLAILLLTFAKTIPAHWNVPEAPKPGPSRTPKSKKKSKKRRK